MKTDKDKKKKNKSTKIRKTKTKSKPAKTLKEAKSQARKAGMRVLKARQQVKKLGQEPQGHFNKKVIGSPRDLRNSISANIPNLVKKRDSLRGVVRNFKKKNK